MRYIQVGAGAIRVARAEYDAWLKSNTHAPGEPRPRPTRMPQLLADIIRAGEEIEREERP